MPKHDSFVQIDFSNEIYMTIEAIRELQLYFINNVILGRFVVIY